MFLIFTMIAFSGLVLGYTVGRYLGFEAGRNSFRTRLLESKADSANPEELARWRDVIETL